MTNIIPLNLKPLLLLILGLLLLSSGCAVLRAPKRAYQFAYCNEMQPPTFRVTYKSDAFSGQSECMDAVSALQSAQLWEKAFPSLRYSIESCGQHCKPNGWATTCGRLDCGGK